MASTGIMEGRLTYITLAGTQLSHGTTNDWTNSSAMIDITTADSANDAEFLAGIRSRTVSGSFMFAEDATYGYEDLYDLWVAGTAVALVSTTGVTGDMEYTASALISELSKSNPNGEASSCAVSFQITGVVTKAAVV
jgi:hypothetical protein